MTRRTTGLTTALAVLAAVLTAGALQMGGGAVVGAAEVDPGLGFTPITPCRIADTRTVAAPLTDGGTRSFAAAGPGSPCAIPQSASAVEFSVTAVGPAAPGFIRMFPAGTAAPTATFLNYSAGRGVTNTGTVPVTGPSLLDVTVANFGGPTHVVIDVQGYFDSAGGLGYQTLPTPCRAADTRRSPGQRFTDSTVRSFMIAGPGSLAWQGGSPTGCGVPDGVAAVEVSITAVDPSGTGFLRAAPNDGSPFRATVLNVADGAGVTNTGSVALAAAGAFDLAVRNQGGSTDVVIDIHGYYPDSGGRRYHTITPCRVADTRAVGPTGTGTPLGDGHERSLRLAGRWGAFLAQGAPAASGCMVPSGASAVEAAITAIAPSGRGFAQATTPGATGRGTVLNFVAGHSITNVGTLHLGGAGHRDLLLHHQGGTAGYIVDVLGWFDGPENDAGSAEQVDAGGDHTCAVLVDGRAECWGGNLYGQLGDGTRVGRSTPAPIRNVDGFELTGLMQVDAGTSHSCATSGELAAVVCWGYARYGQIGDGTTGDGQSVRSHPTVVRVAPDALLVEVAQVAVGDNHTCAVRSNGTVACWGLNTSGQLGSGAVGGIDQPTVHAGHVVVPGGTLLGDAVQITAGAAHTCALMRDTTVRCWGENSLGQLGTGSAGADRPFPTPVTTFAGGPALAGAIQLSAGANHTCATLSDSSVRCWGQASSAQLGTGSWDGVGSFRAVPSTVRNPVTMFDVLDVTGGTQHTCARLEDTTARCWGSRLDGRIGDSSAADGFRTGPTTVGAPIRGVVELTAGGRHTCMLHDWGAVRCWGDDALGQVGDGVAGDNLSPTLVQGFGA